MSDGGVETTLTVVTIDPQLARRLKAAGENAAADRKVADASDAERDALIREARAAGGSLREIAAVVGLSHTQVKNIAHGRAPRRPTTP
jgi:DNA invertase Pin-like site-specific DNA recombinase